MKISCCEKKIATKSLLKRLMEDPVVWSKFTQVVDDKDNYTNYVACNKCKI